MIRTLREGSDRDTMKMMRKHLSQDTVRNKDRMAVDPILHLAATGVVAILEDIGTISHTLVPEKYKWTDDNKIGMFHIPLK